MNKFMYKIFDILDVSASTREFITTMILLGLLMIFVQIIVFLHIGAWPTFILTFLFLLNGWAHQLLNWWREFFEGYDNE